MQIFLIALVEMFGKFNLVLLLELDIVFDEVVGSVSGFFAHLLVHFVEFGLVEQGHLDHLLVIYHLLVLVQVLLLEEGSIFVCACDIGPDFIEAGCGDQGFYFVQQLLDFHVPGEARVDFDGRLQVGLVGLDSEYYFKHGVEDHF